MFNFIKRLFGLYDLPKLEVGKSYAILRRAYMEYDQVFEILFDSETPNTYRWFVISRDDKSYPIRIMKKDFKKGYYRIIE